jgi:hypothetical protein
MPLRCEITQDVRPDRPPAKFRALPSDHGRNEIGFRLRQRVRIGFHTPRHARHSA